MSFSLSPIPYPLQFPRPFVERPYYDLANLSSDKRQPALIATIQTISKSLDGRGKRKAPAFDWRGLRNGLARLLVRC